MFAFAIHDRTTDEVTLVRDRYGKKPLYYTQDGGVVYFSSEMKGLMVGRSGLQIDQQALLEWSLYRNVDALAPRTLVTLQPLDPRANMRFRMGTRAGSRRLDGTPVPLRSFEPTSAPVYL